MQVAQPAIDKLGFRGDNASLIIEERPRIDPTRGTPHDWGLYLAELERIASGGAFFEPRHLTTYPRLFIGEFPKYQSVTASVDFGTCSTGEQDALIDEMLPRLARRTLPVGLVLTIGGRGKPIFRIETEISLDDED
jgi:hypothetical protein